MVEAQQWLDKNYPDKLAKKEVEMLIIGKYANAEHDYLAEGLLNISNFAKLKRLYFFDNKITKLVINNYSELEFINCSGNFLTDLDFLSALSSEKITNLYLKNNNISEQDLSCFSKLVNLTTLLIGNSDESKIKQGIYNRFTGSLEFLKDLTVLKRLDIRNTDIDSGLEYLPNSVKEFHCSTDERKESKVKEIETELEPFLISKFQGTYKFDDWRIKKGIILPNLPKEKQIVNAKPRKRKISKKETFYQGKCTTIRRKNSKINSFGQKKETGQFMLEWENKTIIQTELSPIRNQENWKDISLDFENNNQLTQEWQDKGFNYNQTKDWIGIGLKVFDANFCAWLRDIKQVASEWVLNNSDVEDLRKEFQQWVASELSKKGQQQFQQIETNFYKKYN